MPWPRQTVNKVRPAGWFEIDEQVQKMQSPAHEGPSPRDSAEKRTAPAKWIFALLVFLAIALSRVKWNSAHRNAVTRENRVYRKSLDLSCAPLCSRGIRVARVEGKNCAAKGRSSKMFKPHCNLIESFEIKCIFDSSLAIWETEKYIRGNLNEFMFCNLCSLYFKDFIYISTVK